MNTVIKDLVILLMGVVVISTFFKMKEAYISQDVYKQPIKEVTQ